MAELHETRIGQQFLDRTIPELVRQLQRLNENLERRDLRQATASIVAAAERVLDVEIVPGSKATIEAFDELRRAVREAREAIAESRG